MLILIFLAFLRVLVGISVYDSNLAVFSPQGELLQVEYAKKAGNRGDLVIVALTECSSNAIICIPTKKIHQKLLDRRSIDKIVRIDDNSFVVLSGLASDGRFLVQECRKYSLEHFYTYGCLPTTFSIARHIGEMQHEATLSGGTVKLLWAPITIDK